MHAADEKESPVDGEAEDIGRLVEVRWLGCSWWERPVERRERRCGVAQRRSAAHALYEAVVVSKGVAIASDAMKRAYLIGGACFGVRGVLVLWWLACDVELE